MFDVNWETRSHADIHAQLQGRGGGFTDAGGAWNSLATRLRDVAGSVERATSGIAATRTGAAAQAAGGAVGPMGPWAAEARAFSDAVGSASHEQNRALAVTRGAVGPPVPRPPVTLQTWEGVGALAALDVDSAEHASLDAERRARAAMGRYQEFSSLRASGLPQFSSPSQGPPQVQVVTGASPPGPGAAARGVLGSTPRGGTAGGPVAGGASESPRPGSSGARPPGPAQPGLPAPGGTGGTVSGPGLPGAGGVGGVGGAVVDPARPGRPGTPVGPARPGAAPPTGATGPVPEAPVAPRPGAAGTTPVFEPGGGTGTVGTGFGTNSPGSGAAGTGTGTAGTGFGTNSLGSGAAGGGTGTAGTGFSSTTAASGAAGGGTGTSGTGFGTNTTGSSTVGSSTSGSGTASRTAVEPTRLGGASVLEPALPPRPSATTGVPFAPVGGVGAADPAEQRLSRAAYLVEDDPDALAGPLPRVAPPVIGA